MRTEKYYEQTMNNTPGAPNPGKCARKPGNLNYPDIRGRKTVNSNFSPVILAGKLAKLNFRWKEFEVGDYDTRLLSMNNIAWATQAQTLFALGEIQPEDSSKGLIHINVFITLFDHIQILKTVAIQIFRGHIVMYDQSYSQFVQNRIGNTKVIISVQFEKIQPFNLSILLLLK